MIKAAFFDVDGTLYSHKTSCVTESNLKVLEKLREKGIKIFLATGRHSAELIDLHMEHMEFDGYVMLNGQICMDHDKNVFFGNEIKREDAEIFFDAFESKALPVLMIEKDCLYVNLQNEVVANAQAEISTPIPELGEYQGAPIYQMVVFGGKELEEEYAHKLANCKMTRWCPYGVDIISKNGGKSVGIQKVLEHYGIKKEEMIAFGDSYNDIDMLQFAGVGVAMGNAADEAKAAADYVTADIDDEGILKACKHFGLI